MKMFWNNFRLMTRFKDTVRSYIQYILPRCFKIIASLINIKTKTMNWTLIFAVIITLHLMTHADSC